MALVMDRRWRRGTEGQRQMRAASLAPRNRWWSHYWERDGREDSSGCSSLTCREPERQLARQMWNCEEAPGWRRPKRQIQSQDSAAAPKEGMREAEPQEVPWAELQETKAGRAGSLEGPTVQSYP